MNTPNPNPSPELLNWTPQTGGDCPVDPGVNVDTITLGSATSNNPQSFVGLHYWPADHFSVPADSLCLNIAPSPNADCWCIREAGHRGDHTYECSPDIRRTSWKDTA